MITLATSTPPCISNGLSPRSMAAHVCHREGGGWVKECATLTLSSALDKHAHAHSDPLRAGNPRPPPIFTCGRLQNSHATHRT
jgi:hypothetical protein